MTDVGGTGPLRSHPNYARLSALSRSSHERGRAALGIDQRDIALARLYSHAFRAHVIGAFHATRERLQQIEISDPLARLQILRADEALTDLVNRGMDDVGRDARALVSTFHHYHAHVARTVAALGEPRQRAGSAELNQIRDRFVSQMEAITCCNGIHLTQDTGVPDQASFVVPHLGVTIVPLVYGDYHSWNLAWLDGVGSDVPYHLHHEGVEIHLGYGTMQGYTVLGEAKAKVTEAYAMPIPPEMRHGYTNIGPQPHHVPFVFGSQTCGGWGIFLDVEPQPLPLDQLTLKPLLSPALNHTILLEARDPASGREAARRPLSDHSGRCHGPEWHGWFRTVDFPRNGPRPAVAARPVLHRLGGQRPWLVGDCRGTERSGNPRPLRYSGQPGGKDPPGWQPAAGAA